ncbi:MAG TPA: hypothetical protein VMR70_15915 [Flavisolibacter sp.]|nr:hypothetical protein [Flavisolibacter sp.]
MQTLFLPDIIHIDFHDKDGNALRQENILIGIHTFATHKNNINLSPFLSDKDGHITITKEQLQNRADNFISYGIMDYGSLDSAKPDIQIFFWGNDSIDRYMHYWKMILKNKKDRQQYEMWGDIMGKFARQSAELEIREREELHLFETCFNRTTKQRQDIILVNDTWDTPMRERNYIIILSV